MTEPSDRRDERLLTGAVGLSALGDFLALVPLALAVEEATGSGLAVAALFVALWAPSVVLAGPAGLIADRADPRRVLALASAAQAATAVALALTVPSTAAVLALALLLGVGAAFGQPAEFAIAPRLRRAGPVRRVNARLETARYAGFALGPLLGGVLAASGGTRTALLVDAASFALIAIAATRVATRPAQATTEPASRPERARDGIAFLTCDRVLRDVLPVAVVALLFMTATATAEVFFARDVLHAGDAGYGALTTAWFAGMVAGALLIAPRVGSARAASVALVAIALQGAAIALPAAWPVILVALAAYAGGGLAHGVKNVVIRTLIHERAPGRLHGRAFAAYNALRNAAELSALTLGGVLVTVAGPRLTLAVAGGVPAVLVALTALRRTRRSAPRPRPARGRYRPGRAPASVAASHPGTPAG